MKRVILMLFVFYISIASSNAALGAEVSNDTSECGCMSVGNQWEYKLFGIKDGKLIDGIELQAVKSKVMLNGKEVYPYYTSNPELGEIILYLTLENKKTYLHKMINSQGGYAIPSLPLLLISKKLQLGKTYKNSVPAKFYDADNKLIHKGAMKTEFKLLSYEDVVVPAGNFKNCSKISVVSVQQTEKNLITVDQVRWFLEGIGNVKVQSFTKVEENNKEVHREYFELELKDSNKIKR